MQILFDGQNIGKAGDLKDLHNIRADIAYRHPALLVHGLLGSQQHAQTGGGNVNELCKVKVQLCDVRKGSGQLCFQSGSGGGVLHKIATLPLWATFKAKLIPAIPEPITKKSYFFVIFYVFFRVCPIP